MRLYVGNLSYSTTEETLKTLFSNYADVASVSIAKDRFTQQSKGFGFVEIEDEIKAQRAIGGMNGKDVDGRRIRVSEAVEKPRQEKRDGGFGGYREREERNFSDEYKDERRGYGRDYDGDRFSRRNDRYDSDRRNYRRDYDSERNGRYGDSDGGRREYGRRSFGSDRFDRRDSRGYSSDRGGYREDGRRSYNDSRRFERAGRYSGRDENPDEY